MATDSLDRRKLKVKPPMEKPETVLRVVQRYIRYPDPLPHSMLPKDYFFHPGIKTGGSFSGKVKQNTSRLKNLKKS